MRVPRYSSAVALLATLMLAGCAGSPPVRYYTLVSAAQPATSTTAAASGTMLEVAHVDVPSQVDQPKMMLRDAAGNVTPRYSDRWTSPLADEVRAALSDGLTRRFGVMYVRGVKPASGQQVWRVQVDVQRFDSVENQAAVLDATWRLRGINMPQARASVCRTKIRVETREAGVPGLAVAHQEALQILSEAIAGRLSAAGQAPAGASQSCQTLPGTSS